WSGSRYRRYGGNCGRPSFASRPESPPARAETMINLSEWALKHRSFVIYLMVAAVVAGLVAYYRLGRNLDYVRSYTSAGLTTIFVNLKQATRGSEVPDIWYHVRKSIGDIRRTLPD